jgi:predicted phage gp36 major capsid-like protein
MTNNFLNVKNKYRVLPGMDPDSIGSGTFYAGQIQNTPTGRISRWLSIEPVQYILYSKYDLKSQFRNKSFWIEKLAKKCLP